MVAASRVGCAVGWKLHSKANDDGRGHFGGVQAAILGLLALLLGFTLSMADQRFEARRQLMLDDAVALGGLNLRAGFLREPDATEFRTLLMDYVTQYANSDHLKHERGSKLTVVNESKNHYAQVPMRTSIDGLVNKLDQDFGFVPPLADFAVSNPYRELHQQVRAVTYAGRANTGGFLGMGGVECHKIALQGRRADAELWVGVADQLPHRLVATFRHVGNARMRVEFSAWNLAASAPANAAAFTYNPPPGAQKIEMWTTARMNSAHKQ